MYIVDLTMNQRARIKVGALIPLERVKVEHIRRVMNQCDTLDAAANVLEIDVVTLWRLRARHPELQGLAK